MDNSDLCNKIDRLNFDIELSMRYHQRRRAFYDGNYHVIVFLIIISGSAAFSGLSNYFAALAAFFGALDFAWKPSHHSRDHKEFFRRFSNLAIDLRTGSDSEENYAKWKKERIALEADEPPVYTALANDCFNEVNRSRDSSAKLIEIGWWCRLTMNLFRHSKTRFEEEKSLA